MSRKDLDFGVEVSKILPVIMREAGRRQMRILTKGDLTMPQIVILDFLLEKGHCRMGEVAHVLNLTMSAATGIVDKMVRTGFVKRERLQEDRRVVRIILLRKGEQMAKRVSEERRKAANEIFAYLSEAERHEYLRLLRKVYEGLRRV